jgi:hypothetical protein
MPIDSMAVAHSEKVKPLNSTHIRCQYETILILLIRVPWNVANSSCECELCNNVVSFIRWFLYFMSFLLRLVREWTSVIRRLPEWVGGRRRD